MADLSNFNAANVLAKVEEGINDLENRQYKWEKHYKIRDIYSDLSIFDWWNENLSISQLKQMRSFLKTAIKLGFTGYVCFKVGAAGCSHGMWAHKKESTNGYSPDGACLFHSFRNGDNYWSACNENDEWMSGREDGEKYAFTLEEVKQFLAEVH